MDRRQLLAQRAHEYFGERLDDVVQMIRQDRQEMRGWEEPAHLRAVLRSAVRECAAAAGNDREASEAALADLEIGRAAGEPERGQQREAMGQILEVGASALEKVARKSVQELRPEELLGLECVLLLYGRPALLVDQNRLGSVPPLWNLLEDQREDVEMAQRGVGRIELYGHPEFDWAGTGFLVSEQTLMTTRRTVELFAEQRGDSWQFRPGISAWMDYRTQQRSTASAGYRVRSIIGVHELYDLALLEVDPPQQAASAPVPLALASQWPARVEGRPVYLVGYPLRDARRNEPEPITRIFRDVYNAKRVQPGNLRGTLQFREVQLLQHDCAPLGQTAGGAVIDVETQQVLGLQLYSRYLETGTAVPLWVLREDPLLRRGRVTFAEATAQQLQTTASQVERLARSRAWAEVREYVDSVYRRTFGTNGAATNQAG